MLAILAAVLALAGCSESPPPAAWHLRCLDHGTVVFDGIVTETGSVWYWRTPDGRRVAVSAESCSRIEVPTT